MTAATGQKWPFGVGHMRAMIAALNMAYFKQWPETGYAQLSFLC